MKNPNYNQISTTYKLKRNGLEEEVARLFQILRNNGSTFHLQWVWSLTCTYEYKFMLQINSCTSFICKFIVVRTFYLLLLLWNLILAIDIYFFSSSFSSSDFCCAAHLSYHSHQFKVTTQIHYKNSVSQCHHMWCVLLKFSPIQESISSTSSLRSMLFIYLHGGLMIYVRTFYHQDSTVEFMSLYPFELQLGGPSILHDKVYNLGWIEVAIKLYWILFEYVVSLISVSWRVFSQRLFIAMYIIIWEIYHREQWHSILEITTTYIIAQLHCRE